MIIWIAPKWPLPATDGARIATTQLLRHLTARGAKIHLCALVPASEVEMADVEAAKRELGVGWVTILPRRAPSRFGQLLRLFLQPHFPVTLSPFADRNLRALMAGFLSGRHFDLVVYDGLHAGAWGLAPFTDPALQKIVQGREVYRAHNVESEIWFAGSREAKNPLKKFLLYFQGLLVRRLETKLLLRAQYTFPVSFDDEHRFRLHQPPGYLKALPIGVTVGQASITVSEPGPQRKFLFVGKLDWPPNRDGLIWLLTHVWPRAVAAAPDIKLRIVGSGERSWLDQFGHLPGVEIVGRVEDLAPHYQDCVATLIPVFYGSGVRVKAIESSLFRRACISTGLGVEGMGLSPGHHYARAESVEEWVHAITQMDAHTAGRLADRAHAYAKVAFDPVRVAQSFTQAVGMEANVHAG